MFKLRSPERGSIINSLYILKLHVVIKYKRELKTVSDELLMTETKSEKELVELH